MLLFKSVYSTCFLFLCAEVVEAEVSRSVHAVVTRIGGLQLATDFIHDAEVLQLYIRPVGYDKALAVTEISQVELNGTGLNTSQIAGEGQLEIVNVVRDPGF